MGNRVIYVIERDERFLMGVKEDSEGIYIFTNNLDDAMQFESKNERAPKQARDNKGNKIKSIIELSKYLSSEIKSYKTAAIYTKI